MRPKNVMLLGFVNRAVEYLDQHLEDENNTTLDELKSIDLASLKDELSENLDASLGIVQSTMTTLLHAGGAAFDKFIDNHSEDETFTESVDRIFDVDLDEKAPETNKDNLTELLSFYNLDDDFAIDDDVQYPEDEYLEQISNNISKEENVVEKKNEDTTELDNIFSEIVSNENKPVEKAAPLENKKYVSSLIDDLKKQMIKEDELKKERKVKIKEVLDRVHKIYPYLDDNFIANVYSLKNSIAKEYQIGIQIVVLHRVKFNAVENLRQFVEITTAHNYTINADENKMIVDCFKQFENTDGKILNNIFEVANQGKLLDGEYEGYQVLVNEEE